MWFADVEDRADDLLERDSLKQALARGIGQLPEREAMVLQLYFVEEMNLEEIGQKLDIGAARVCQIKKVAVTKLRSLFSEWRSEERRVGKEWVGTCRSRWTREY